MTDIILKNGKTIETHPCNKRRLFCQLCEKKTTLQSHHISYKDNVCVTLCRKHHAMVHNHKNHALHPQDKRQNLIIKLNTKNSNNLRLYFGKYNTNDVVNKILEKRLEEGDFQLQSSKDKKISDLISWKEFKKIGGSFMMADPNKLNEFLNYIFFEFNTKINRLELGKNIRMFLQVAHD